MFGKLLGAAIKTITLPLDAANIALDTLDGGSGSKQSRSQNPLLGDLEKIRDRVVEAAEEIDD